MAHTTRKPNTHREWSEYWCELFAELAEASADYSRLIQVEKFDRNEIAVHRAYERVRAAIAKGRE